MDAEIKFPLEDDEMRHAGLYVAMFGTKLSYPRYPWHLARQQRSIENNQTPIYGEPMSHSLGTSPVTKFSQNSSASSSPSLPLENIPSPNIFTKEDYMRIVKAKRQAFVHANFCNVLTELFTLLKEDADCRKPCHREVVFEVPEHFDIEKTERALIEYFTDCGYKGIAEARKDYDQKIVITIT